MDKNRRPLNQEDNQSPQPTKSIEVALEVNGTTQNLEALAQLDESQATISGQLVEETTVNASAWPKWLMGEQPKVVGTSNQPP